ncbi:MAG: DUF2283 domain-containing protein [Nitrososphaerota archaeon]|nr:DUF2283 domain-containing protein [Nitrososphaerota archaeon]
MRRYSVEYDPESDAAYVRLTGERSVKDAVEIEEGVFADLDETMSVVGIEILNFSKRKNVSLDELVAKCIENIMISR